MHNTKQERNNAVNNIYTNTEADQKTE